jgi:Tfp pilus assembly PilM family ATPase
MLGWPKKTQANGMLGLDITNGQVHMVSANLVKSRPNLLSSKRLDLPSDAFDIDGIANHELLQALLAPELSQYANQAIAISLNNSLLQQRQIQCDADLSEEDIEENVALEIERQFGFNVDDSYFDFSTLGVNPDDENLLNIQVVACLQQTVNDRYQWLAALDYPLQLIACNDNVLGNLLHHQAQDEAATVGIINFTPNNAELVINGVDYQLHDNLTLDDGDDAMQSVESLISLAGAQRGDVQLDTLWLSGNIMPQNVDLVSLSDALACETKIIYPFQHWSTPSTAPVNKQGYTLAAATVWEALLR